MEVLIAFAAGVFFSESVRRVYNKIVVRIKGE